MSQKLYEWLEKSIKEYYQPVKIIKRSEKKEITLYQHKESGRTVIAKRLKYVSRIYERLTEIGHVNLVRVIEAVSSDSRTIVMEEYLDGMTVADVLESGRFSQKEVSRIVMQVCDGLNVLHKHQIIHRDIKPENVFIMSDGNVKIIDFDASRVYREYEKKDTVALGTIGYAAPEQYGESQTDERSDIYALGILMNVMLTGKHPVNEMAQREAGKIIEKCIRVNPGNRYRTVMEVKEKLKRL